MVVQWELDARVQWVNKRNILIYIILFAWPAQKEQSLNNRTDKSMRAVLDLCAQNG